MRRLWLYGGLGLALCLAVAAQWISARWVSPTSLPRAPSVHHVEIAPMCPWRQPQSDLRAFFPGATRYETEVRILSGERLELRRRLGRMPDPEEHTLYVHRVYEAQRPLGTVLTRRVKGEYGAIEIVLAVGSDDRVRGMRVQRLREPLPIARELQSARWLHTLEGKTAQGAWQVGEDVPAVTPQARASANAVLDGARSLLILLDVAEQRRVPVKKA